MNPKTAGCLNRAIFDRKDYLATIASLSYIIC